MIGGWFWRRFAEPQVQAYLLHGEGEQIIDEVRHHWMAYWRALLELVVATVMLYLFLISPEDISWLPFWLFLGFGLHAAWLALSEHVDRFVITNMRVFRVRGVFNTKRATMPMTRILDITVEKPLLGRFFDYGHFVFESAAQEQGLKKIRYVGSPDERDLTIQRVVQRSGLRRFAGGPR